MTLIQSVFFLFVWFTPIKHSVHMFQQQHYCLDRYGPWLKMKVKNSKKAFFLWSVSTCGFYCLLRTNALQDGMFELLCSLYGVLFWRIESFQTYRKPLVYTARIKRLLLMDGFILLMLLYLYTHMVPYTIFLITIPFLFELPWLILILSASCMQPIEDVIKKRYVKKAKKILEDRNSMISIAITGSYGKTTVKNILYHLCKEEYYTLQTPHSYNNQMGITKTILEYLEPLHELFLCEMGSDHVGELAFLMDLVQPQYGVVTSLGNQHLKTFKTKERICQEKMQVIEHLPEHGIGFLNRDCKELVEYPIQNTCAIVWFGKDEDADYRYQLLQYTKQGTLFSITHHGETRVFQTTLLGEQAMQNITCAVAVADTLSVPFAIIEKQVRMLPSVPHRLEKKTYGRKTILDDAYNANPVGFRYALDVLKTMEGQRILVTPGCIDLGQEQDVENFRIGQYMADCIDDVIFVGIKQTESMVKGLKKQQFSSLHIYLAHSFEEAQTMLKQIASEDATILLENDLPDAFHQ